MSWAIKVWLRHLSYCKKFLKFRYVPCLMRAKLLVIHPKHSNATKTRPINLRGIYFGRFRRRFRGHSRYFNKRILIR